MQPNLVFFTDRDIGPTHDCDVVRTLRGAGLRVESHSAHFAEGRLVKDSEWLALCGEKDWLAISHDDRIRYSPLAQRTIAAFGTRLFVLIGQRPYVQLAQNFIHSLSRVESCVGRNEDGFIARVYMTTEERFVDGRSGAVTEWRVW